MRRNLPTLRLFCSAVLGLALIVPSQLQAANELERHLRDQYQDKTLLLRDFYAGDSLRYDASGQLSKSETPGDWTVDGVVHVDDVRVSTHRLTIRAKRLHMGWVRDVGFSDVPESIDKGDQPDARSLRIEADFAPAEVTSDNADALLARIFLTAKDRFADLVPDYWKPCVLAASAGKSKGKYPACRFPPEIAAIPGVVFSLDENSESQVAGDGEAKAAEIPLARIGKGVTIPKVILQKDPPFSDEARRAKYQGTATLMFIVDKTGQVQNIRILRPLGMGLDQKAVETVSKWQFHPARKDGEPVAVELAVEVDFHLY